MGEELFYDKYIDSFGKICIDWKSEFFEEVDIGKNCFSAQVIPGVYFIANYTIYSSDIVLRFSRRIDISNVVNMKCIGMHNDLSNGNVDIYEDSSIGGIAYYNPMRNFPIGGLFPKPSKARIFGGDMDEFAIDKLSLRSRDLILSFGVASQIFAEECLQKIMSLSPDDLACFWRKSGTYTIQKIIEHEPSIIRMFVDAFELKFMKSESSFDLWYLEYLKTEVEQTVEEYGLDPVWIDYVKQRMEVMIHARPRFLRSRGS